MLTGEVDWRTLNWPDFVRAVEAYRDYFSQKAQEDAAYLRCYRIPRGDTSMIDRVRHGGDPGCDPARVRDEFL